MASRKGWTLSLGVLVVFGAGVVVGVLGAAAYVHHRLGALHEADPHALHALGMHWLDSELDLTAQQAKAVEEILNDAHLELFRFKSRHNEEIREIVLPALERVNALLMPSQAERWEPIRQRIVEHAEATLDSEATTEDGG
jgi:hypothetical protein